MDNGFAGTLKKKKTSETGSFCMQYQYHLHCYRTKNHLLRILPPKIYIFDTAETPLPNCLALTQSWKKPIFKWGGNPFPIFHPLSHHCLTPLKTLVKNSNRPKNVGGNEALTQSSAKLIALVAWWCMMHLLVGGIKCGMVKRLNIYIIYHHQVAHLFNWMANRNFAKYSLWCPAMILAPESQLSKIGNVICVLEVLRIA